MKHPEMELIFLTSGSGTTAKYITEKHLGSFDGIRYHNSNHNSKVVRNITIRGFIYEHNETMIKTLEHLKLFLPDNGQVHYNQVARSDHSNSEVFHSAIWDIITSWREGDGNGHSDEFRIIGNSYLRGLIVLAGWMHIVPESFIQQCHQNGYKILNLHPTLQYQLIGRDVYPKIWKMYKDGMIQETGCMVHYVSRNLDRGELILEHRLNLNTCPDYESYHRAMYGVMSGVMSGMGGLQTTNSDGIAGGISGGISGVIDHENPGLEKLCLLEAINMVYDKHRETMENGQVMEITPYSFPAVCGLKLRHRGKVRDIYESRYYKDYLFVITSDRISANDIVISHLPEKGKLLNQINTFWHKLFGIDQMVCSSDDNLMVIRKMRAIPLEIIVRRRITGSLWKMYSQNGIRSINGYTLAEGMKEGDRFNEPIITPTTKGTHDYPITFAEIAELGILNRREIDIIRNKATGLFKMAEAYLANIGVEMIDTKFEFGFTIGNGSSNDSGSIEFIDELFTPDSSRFIVAGQRMDKDILRRWAHDHETEILSYPPGPDGCRAVPLPRDVRSRLIANYRDFLNRLTADKLQFNNIMQSHRISNDNSYNGDEECDIESINGDGNGYGDELEPGYNPLKAVQIYNALTRLSKVVIILAGSKSDAGHVDKIRDELRKRDILAFVYYSSAHKNTETVMQILQAFETRTRTQIIYITVAGMSNALSGVVAANVSRPVIACPPFNDKDKSDYQINIHSTLQMPSAVPVACILRPDNVAAFCSRMLDL